MPRPRGSRHSINVDEMGRIHRIEFTLKGGKARKVHDFKPGAKLYVTSDGTVLAIAPVKVTRRIIRG